MPAGRPSKILTSVEVNGKPTPITQAILSYVELGVYPTTAARAHGIHETTMANWQARGREVEALVAESEYVMNEQEAAYVAFLGELSRAEARGLAWHEINVRKAADANREAGGRLSLEFLSRRHRSIYGREIAVQHEHGGTVKHEQVEAGLDAEIAAFLEANDAAGESANGRGDPSEALGNGSEPRPEAS